MDKEKILQQLKDKLLPSVQNLEKEQATEHDYFPALLWMLLEKSKESESSIKDISSKHNEEIEKATKTIIQNTQESRETFGAQLDIAVNFILSKNQESDIKFEQFYDEQFKKMTSTIVLGNKVSQEKTNELIENKIVVINQKIDEIKNTSLKIEKKFPIGFLVLSIFQLISITILTVILIKQL